MTLEQLGAAYEAKFGKAPEVFWDDDEATLRPGLEEALKTGKPWVREPNEQEGVR